MATKVFTGLDREFAHLFQLHAVKRSWWTAAYPGATGQLSPWVGMTTGFWFAWHHNHRLFSNQNQVGMSTQGDNWPVATGGLIPYPIQQRPYPFGVHKMAQNGAPYTTCLDNLHDHTRSLVAILTIIWLTKLQAIVFNYRNIQNIYININELYVVEGTSLKITSKSAKAIGSFPNHRTFCIKIYRIFGGFLRIKVGTFQIVWFYVVTYMGSRLTF